MKTSRFNFLMPVVLLCCGCGVSEQTHRDTKRQLEDTKIELVKVESQAILSKKSAQRLRAEVNTLRANKKALEQQNKSLKAERLQPSQRDALETLGGLNTARRRISSVLKSDLEDAIKKRQISLAWKDGHPIMTIAFEHLFAQTKTDAAPQVQTDLLTALVSTKTTGIVVLCQSDEKTQAARHLCQQHLQRLTLHAKSKAPTLTLYLHNDIVVVQSKDGKSKYNKKKRIEKPIVGKMTLILLTNLSTLERP